MRTAQVTYLELEAEFEASGGFATDDPLSSSVQRSSRWILPRREDSVPSEVNLPMILQRRPTADPNQAVELTRSVWHAGCGRPADPPAAVAPHCARSSPWAR